MSVWVKEVMKTRIQSMFADFLKLRQDKRLNTHLLTSTVIGSQ
jgi:hypothetical protein